MNDILRVDLVHMEEKAAGIKSEFERKIAHAACIREKIDLRNQLAWNLRSIDTVYALEMSDSAHIESVLHDYDKGRAASLLNSGICHCYLADYEQAMQKFSDALGHFRSLGDRSGEASVNNWTGIVYWRIGDFGRALDHFTVCRNIAEEIGDEQNIIAGLTSVGRIYQELGDYEDALVNHLRSIAMRQRTGTEISAALWDVSRAYLGLQDYDNARKYCLESIEIRSASGDVRGLAGSMHIMGEISEQSGNYKQALIYYHRALRYVSQVNEPWGEARTSLSIGALYTRLSKARKALPRLIHAMKIAGTINAREIVYEAHYELAMCYELMHETRQALHHYKRFHEIKEDVMGKQAEQMLKFYQRGFEIEKAQKEAEIIRGKNDELADALEEVRMLNNYLAQVNQNLEALNEEKNEMLGIVAHDLKNPLSSILMTASMVQTFGDKISQEELMSLMVKLEATALHMKEIISKLLDINAIDSGKINLAMGSHDLTGIIESVLGDYSKRASDKEIRLRNNIAGESLPVFVDRDAAIQIVDNIVSNAIKFSPKGKNVFISAYNHGDRVIFTVEDEGPGFTEADMEKMYRKFARLSARPSAGENSTGLGLSIVKKLIEVMGGNISCESIPGSGATFTVEFSRA